MNAIKSRLIGEVGVDSSLKDILLLMLDRKADVVRLINNKLGISVLIAIGDKEVIDKIANWFGALDLVDSYKVEPCKPSGNSTSKEQSKNSTPPQEQKPST